MGSREERIIAYLNSHPKFLEYYATGPNVSNEAFHRWCSRRNMRAKRESLKELGAPWMVSYPFHLEITLSLFLLLTLTLTLLCY